MRVFAQHAAPRGNPRLHIRDVPLGATIRTTRHAEPVRTICGATLPAGSHDVAPVTPARLAALATITPGAPGWLCQTCRDRNHKPTTRKGAPAMPAKKSGTPRTHGRPPTITSGREVGRTILLTLDNAPATLTRGGSAFTPASIEVTYRRGPTGWVATDVVAIAAPSLDLLAPGGEPLVATGYRSRMLGSGPPEHLAWAFDLADQWADERFSA